jgi:nitroimidazol reductase NimA-like FMN-containing flavoprotein (pyridoxamine 5'-phosphate oxidase superfamily)
MTSERAGTQASATSSSISPDLLVLDAAGLEVLDRHACLQLLATTRRGRMAITVGALPTILPVRFALDGDRIIVAASVGSTLDRATDGNVVAFQADGCDEAAKIEWSVTVVGAARHLTEPGEVQRAFTLGLPRWSATDTQQFIALSTELPAGRRSFP